ncbi:MAG: hypothetical protein K2Y24_11910, partial [Pseudomonadaceae bacterium]|nr:hypothetical protein [Pseudomonadaceae bacterium]
EELATKPNETRHTLLGFAALNTNLRDDRTTRSRMPPATDQSLRVDDAIFIHHNRATSVGG